MLEQVTDAARELMAFKAQTNTIPFAKQVADYFAISTDPEIKKTFGFWASALHFEMRAHSLDYFLAHNQAATVLELSAGFSFRGLEFARKNPNVTYIDTDLDSVIEIKKQMLTHWKEIPPCNLQFQYLDVLDLNAFPKLENEVLIINEGLLLYFDQERQKQILKNIHSLLMKNGGTWATADIYLKHDTSTVGSDQDKKWDTFFKKKNVLKQYFDSFDQAEQFFHDNGFKVIKKYEPEFEKLSSLPFLLNNATPEQLDALRNKGKVQETWHLSLR